MLETYLIYNFVLFGSTAFLWAAEQTSSNKKKYIFITISFLVVFTPAAIRYNIGADYFSYINIYNQLPHGYTKDIEPGFFYLLYILWKLNLPEQYIFIVSSFIIYLIAFISYPKEKKYIYNFCYISLVYLVSFNLIRTAIVISICMLIIKLILENKKHLPAVIVGALGYLIHKSILLIIPYLAIWKSNLTRIFLYKRSLIIVFIIVIVALKYSQELVHLITNSKLINLFGYERYIKSEYFKVNKINTGLLIIFYLTPPIIALYYYKSINIKYRSLIATSSIFIVIAVVLQSVIEIFSRVQRFYMFSYIIIIYIIAIESSIHKKKLFASALFIWLVLNFNHDITVMKSDKCSGSRIAPYVTIFNKKADRSLSGVSHRRCMNWSREKIENYISTKNKVL